MALSLERRWAICWELAATSDEIIRAVHVRTNLMPFLLDFGFTRPVMIGTMTLPAGRFPDWFLETIVNFLRGVLRTGRLYTLEEVTRLLERTYGMGPGAVGPRV